MAFLTALHLLAAVIWIGGMFFSLLALRPAARALDPATRFGLWVRTFGRFFPWVWAAVVTLLVTGYWMALFYLGGMASVGLYVHLMSGVGILMMALFAHLYAVPYRRLKRAVENTDLQDAARQANQVRLFMTANLILGLIALIMGSAGNLIPVLAAAPGR